MTTTIYFAKNAYFLRRTVLKKPSVEEVEEVLGQAVHGLGLDEHIPPDEVAAAAEAVVAEEAVEEAATEDVTEAVVAVAAGEAAPPGWHPGFRTVPVGTPQQLEQLEGVGLPPEGFEFPPEHPLAGGGFVLPGALPGFPGGPPGLVTAGGKHPLVRRQRFPMTITSVVGRDELLSLLREALDASPPDKFGTPALPGYGGGGSLESCDERIDVSRMDEGFCVKHERPADKDAVMAEVAKAGKVEGEEWKESPSLAPKLSLLGGLLKAFGDRLIQSPVEVLGFQHAGEVVAYVRDACLAREKRAAG